MKEQSNRSEFTIGLDLGERRHRFCALNGKGEVEEEGTLGNDRACLARLTARYRGALAVMEAGAHSPWVSRYLEGLGLGSDCIQSAQGAGDLSARAQERSARCADAGAYRSDGSRAALSGWSRHGGGATGSFAHQAARQPGASSSGGDQFCALHAEESWLHGA